MPGFTYSKSSKPGLTSSLVNITSPRKQGSGCGFVAGGMFLLLIFVFLAGGFFAYLFAEDKDESLGSLALHCMKYSFCNERIKNDLNANKDTSANDKLALLAAHEKILKSFDAFSKLDQTRVKKSLGVLFKKFFHDGDLLKKGSLSDELKQLVVFLVPEILAPPPVPEANVQTQSETNPEKNVVEQNPVQTEEKTKTPQSKTKSKKKR